LQRRALEALGESSCSSGTDAVAEETADEGRCGDGKRVASMSTGADSARKRTLWGSSALEMGDHRLFEDGGERGGALVADRVASETASERGGGDGERVGMSMGIDRKANTGAAAHLSEVTALPLSASQSAVMPSAVKVPWTSSR
jgi:hypothetical protein